MSGSRYVYVPSDLRSTRSLSSPNAVVRSHRAPSCSNVCPCAARSASARSISRSRYSSDSAKTTSNLTPNSRRSSSCSARCDSNAIVRQRRTPASVAHVQRARRIGRHELDVHLEPPPRVAPPVVPASRKDLVEHPRELRLGEKEVDEPRACDLDLFHVTRWQLERLQQLLGDVPGLAAEQRGEYQGEVCRGVAVRGIARRFDLELGNRGRAELPRRTRERVDQRLMARHLSPGGFFFELSEVFDSGAFDSAVFGSAGLESPSFVPGFSPARL